MTPAPAPFISYSANHEDVILNRVFAGQQAGFFVDVGAAHPRFENDTKALYDRGWSGINIEPTPDFFQTLSQERPRDLNLNVAVSDKIGEMVLHEVVGTGLSTGDADDAARAAAKGFEVIPRTVPTTTLRHILAEAGVSVIDLLKVDVEGLEFRVLNSNDWDRFRPKVIVVECTYPERRARRENGVMDYLIGQGYRHVYFDGLNDFYVEQHFAAPPGAFDSPVNIFDRFEPLAQHELRAERDTWTSRLDRLDREQRDAVGRLTEDLNIQKKKHRVVEAEMKAQAVDLRNARAEIIAMRERCYGLAAEMEAIALQNIRNEPAPAPPAVAMPPPPIAARPWTIRRLARALARPRHSLRILRNRLSG